MTQLPSTPNRLSIQTMHRGVHAVTHAIIIVRFPPSSLFDPIELRATQDTLFGLVDTEGKRKLVLDLSEIDVVSSQAVGIIMGLMARLHKLPQGALVLAGLRPRMDELLKICGLLPRLTIQPTPELAVRFPNVA